MEGWRGIGVGTAGGGVIGGRGESLMIRGGSGWAMLGVGVGVV